MREDTYGSVKSSFYFKFLVKDPWPAVASSTLGSLHVLDRRVFLRR